MAAAAVVVWGTQVEARVAAEAVVATARLASSISQIKAATPVIQVPHTAMLLSRCCI
jgi:hypothetical protein